MVREDYIAVCDSGLHKLELFRHSPFAYLVSSVVAGILIALGGVAAVTAGGLSAAAGSGIPRLLTAVVFAAALSLVVAAGCDLFTGNNLVLGAASMRGNVPWRSTLVLWAICWAGNLLGSLVIAGLFGATGVVSDGGDIAQAFAAAATSKVHMTAAALLARGILCNVCVCLAVWCSYRLKNEAARLIMVFWCIVIFMVCGYEHSVANMGILSVALISGADVTVGACLRNLMLVTIGNVIGGVVFVALPYCLIARGEA